MKKLFYVLLAAFLVPTLAMAQTTVLDFQAPATSTTFQYFGSSLEATLSQVVANPNASGINTSSMVTRFVKPAGSQTWAGGFSNPNPTTPFNFTANGKVRIKVYMDHIGPVALKFEGSATGQPWISIKTNTVINQWETLEYDVTSPSAEAPNNTASGHTYNTMVVFFGFGNAGGATDVVSYFDDVQLVAAAPVVTSTSVTFETAAASPTFQYFGSSLEGQMATVVSNPAPGGINTSSKVGRFTKPAEAQTWAGAFSGSNPEIVLDFTTNGKVKVKVRMNHIGNLAIKLENSSNGGPAWIGTKANTLVNQWEELEFDVSQPSAEAPSLPALGYTYKRVVLFFDFGIAGTTQDVISYFDDIVAVPGATLAITNVLNFESTNTSSPFFYFGSSLEAQLTTIVANPAVNPGNTSANVVRYVKAAGAQTWAGAFSTTTNPQLRLDMAANSKIKIKVRMDHVGNVALKLENSTNGGANWITQQPVTLANGWQELTFNAADPSFEGGNTATGFTYTRVVLFFDFGTPGGTADEVYYFDDIKAEPAVGCVAPTSVSVALQSPTSVTFTYPAVYDASKYNFQYRLAGTTTWTSKTSFFTFLNLTGLQANSNYEYRGRSFCTASNKWTAYGSISTFSTMSNAALCSTPTTAGSYNISSSSVKIYWNMVPGAEAYQVRRSVAGQGVYTTFTGVAPNRTFTGLVGNTQYEWQVRTKCGSTFSAWSPAVTFTTLPSSGLVAEETDFVVAEGVETNRTVLSPNPVATELNVFSEEMPAAIRVIGLNGGLVANITPAETARIDVSTWNSGLYFVVIVAADGSSETHRFIKL